MTAAHRLLRNSSQPPYDEKSKTPEELPGELPGELMMWVLIISELVVFGAGLLALLATRLSDPQGFAEAQSHLHRVGAGINTVVLVTSGYLAARAVPLAGARPRLARTLLIAAAGLGAVFLIVKAREYTDLFAMGIGTETHAFFTFSFLLTGFHAAHVLAGMILLLAMAYRPAPRPVETVAAFWHMVDLVWVLLVPVVYLL